MSITKEEFGNYPENPILVRNARKVLEFLMVHYAEGYKVSEICTNLDMMDLEVSPALQLLKRQKKVEHKRPYWIYHKYKE